MNPLEKKSDQTKPENQPTTNCEILRVNFWKHVNTVILVTGLAAVKIKSQWFWILILWFLIWIFFSLQDYFPLWKSYWFKQRASDWCSRWLHPQHRGRLNCSFLANKNFKTHVKSSMLIANFVHWTDFFNSRKYHSFIFKFLFCYEFKHNILSSPASQKAIQSQNEELKATISIWQFLVPLQTEQKLFFFFFFNRSYSFPGIFVPTC